MQTKSMPKDVIDALIKLGEAQERIKQLQYEAVQAIEFERLIQSEIQLTPCNTPEDGMFILPSDSGIEYLVKVEWDSSRVFTVRPIVRAIPE